VRIRTGAGGGARYDESLPMLARVDLRGSADVRAALARPPAASNGVAAAVAAIVAEVRARGDEALRACTERFDGARLDALAVPPAELDAAAGRLDPDLLSSLELAHAQIEAWHRVQAGGPIEHERAGVRVREVLVPVDRAGCYVPGGRAPLA